MKEVQTLGEVLKSFDSGRIPIKSSDRVAGDVPYLGASGTVDHVDGFTHDGSFLCVSEDGANLLTRSLPISWVQDGKFWANNHLHVLGGVSRDRLKFFQYAVDRANIAALVTGSAQPKLTQSAVMSIQVPSFGAARETAIGGFLASLDGKIAANNKVIDSIHQLLKALWNERTAEGAVAEISDAFELNPRTSTPKSETCTFLDMKALPENGLVPTEWSTREAKGGSKFMNGDVLLARITPCFENGKKGIVDFLADGEVGMGSTEYIVFRPKPGVPTATAFCVISDSDFRAQAAQSMIGTSGRQRVQAKSLESVTIRWPDEEGLRSFGEISDSLLSIVTAKRNENQILARTRDELLPLLMNGTITVREAASEVQAKVGDVR